MLSYDDIIPKKGERMTTPTHEERVKRAKELQGKEPAKAEVDNSLSVRKSNQLIQRNRFIMTVRERRLLFYCISKIKPSDKGGETYVISINDVCRACGIDGKLTGGAYSAMKDALKKLDSFNFELIDENGRRHIVHWIRSVVIDPEEKKSGKVQFEFDPKIVPYLFDVRKKFTQYELRNVLRMKSGYGSALYELLKSYANIKRKKFTLEELRYLLGAEEKSYSHYGILKQRVIDPAMKDIATYSDLKVDYIEIKEGRKVVAVEFIITDIGGTVEYYEKMGLFNDGE